MRKIHAHLLIAALALTTLGGVLASGARKEALETKAAAEEVLYTHTWASGDFDTTKYWSVDGGKFGANAVSSIEGDGVTFQANQYLWRFKYNNSERKRVDNIYIPMRIYGTVTVEVQDESCPGGQYLLEFMAHNGDTAINIKNANITGSEIEIYLNWDYGNRVAATCRFIYGETVKFATALTNTVTLNRNGGSGGSSSATASQGEAMPSISVPSRTGYTFLGYFDNSSGGTKYYNANGTSARNWDKGNDTTLYAQWSANTYTISYSANAPSNRSHQVANMPANQTVTYDTNVTLGSAPTLTGWSFLGWYNSSLTTKIGNAGQTLTKPNLAASGTVTLNANWQANTYTVKYDANKPTNATSNVSNLPNDSTWTYDATCTLPSQTPTLEGWTFGGWYKEASCTNKLGNAGGSLSKPNLRETAGTVKVYAKWIPNTYTVKYNANKPERAPEDYEVTGLPENVTWTYDSETPVSFGSAPELDGYKFDGWFNDANCQNKVAEAEESSVKPNLASENGANADLYAKWVFNDAVQAVVDEINATKTVGYDGLTAQIEIAESAYAGLNDINKAVVDSEGYRHILDNANAADEVGQMIEDLGVALDTDEWREEVGEVREAYMALEDKTYIPNETILSILEDDEAAIIVMDAINEIGATRYNEASKGKIDAAQDAYDAYIDAAHPHEQIANYGKLTAAHTDYDNVQTFVDKVNDITNNPFEYTEGCLALIEEARDYFETALSDYQKNLATTDAGSYYDLLVNYERAYNAMHLIDEINDMVDEASCGEKIDSARSAVSSLNAETELTLMREDLLKELDDKEAAWGVMNLINDIYPMSYGMNCLRDIEEARSAYDVLNDERKELVANYAELTKAEEDYSSVEAVVGEVNSLCAIRHDEESLAKIVSARNHYEALTADQKGFFPNYSLQEIVDYETVYEALNQIYEIGVVEYDSEPEGRINKARTFYDSLTPEQKMLMDPEDLNVLKTAENRYAELTKNAQVLVIFLLILVCLLILGAAYILYILLFRNKDDGDEEENTKEVQKAASFGGLTIGVILTSHYLDAPYIALYVLSGIAVIAWTACLVIYLKKRYDKWAKENEEEGESRGHKFIRLLVAIKDWALKLLKKLSPKKGEEKLEEETPIAENETAVEPKESIAEDDDNEEEEEVFSGQDEEGHTFEIRRLKSFTAKLSQIDEEGKEYYNTLKNHFLSYKGVDSRVSWNHDYIRIGKTKLAQFSIRGKTLCVFFALDPSSLEERFKVEETKGKKKADFPCLYRIKNNRRCRYAEEIYDRLASKLSIEKGTNLSDDYRLPFETDEVLLAKGLIKEVKNRK